MLNQYADRAMQGQLPTLERIQRIVKKSVNTIRRKSYNTFNDEQQSNMARLLKRRLDMMPALKQAIADAANDDDATNDDMERAFP